MPLQSPRLDQFRFFNALGRMNEGRAIRGLWVFEDFPFEIADHNAVGVPAQDIVRVDGHFAAAARSVDDVLWDGVTGGVTAEAFHDLEALADAGAQVSR